MGRRQWNDDVHDLSVHRATRLEREQRRLRYTSPNVEEARQELEERRRALEERRRALAGGNFRHVLAALDLHNKARSAGQGQSSIQEDAHHDADMPSDAGAPAPKIQVETTFTMREAAFEQSAGAISLGDAGFGSDVAGDGWHPRHRLLARHEAQQEAPHAQPTEETAPEAASRPEDPAPSPAVRRPDKLGLSRLQHGLERLDAAVAGYERTQAPPDEASVGPDSSRAPAAATSTKRRRDRKPQAAPVSYMGCNEKTLELFTRFAHTLTECESRRADQERLCREMEVEMRQFREASEKQAAQARTDIAALQSELSTVRREHDMEIRGLTARVASLESSRNEGYLRSLMGGLQAQEEEWASMPITSLDPPSVPALAPMPGSCRAPSSSARLFTPLRLKFSPLGGSPESDDDLRPHHELRVSAERAARSPSTPVATVNAVSSPIVTTPDAEAADAQWPEGGISSVQTPQASLLSKDSPPPDSPHLSDLSPSTIPPPTPQLAAASGWHTPADAPAKANHDGTVSVHLSDLPAAPTADTYAQWGTWGKRFSEHVTPPQTLPQPVSVHKTRLRQPPGGSVPLGAVVAGSWEALRLSHGSSLYGSPVYSLHSASPKPTAVPMAPRIKVPRPTCT
jgi:hypothetical protein